MPGRVLVKDSVEKTCQSSVLLQAQMRACASCKCYSFHSSFHSISFSFQMNLRSVFTVEQQRILQRYYENGMTNQSKNCFQLILQCAQETKLDFSVVRVSTEAFQIC